MDETAEARALAGSEAERAWPPDWESRACPPTPTTVRESRVTVLAGPFPQQRQVHKGDPSFTSPESSHLEHKTPPQALDSRSRRATGGFTGTRNGECLAARHGPCARGCRRPPLPSLPARPTASERPFWNVNWKHRLQPLAPQCCLPLLQALGSRLGTGPRETRAGAIDTTHSPRPDVSKRR